MININSKNICENCFKNSNTSLCPHCGYENGVTQVDTRLLAPGSILLGKYIVGKPLGVGGFGVTYLGYDAVQDKTVAIKEYFPQGFVRRESDSVTVSVSEENIDDHNNGKEKFYEEAKIVSRFNGNPNIVGVYEFFYENNTAYFIMEYLSGMDFKHYIKNRGGKISDGEALTVLNDISSALMVIHSANVLHRDIAPDNIFLCENGDIKLVDFGAARQYSSEQSKNLSVILKQGFAPLEQYQKRGKQGPWTDIYALGATAYYALTGELLDDPMSRLEEDKLVDPETAEVNENLYAIIEKCIKLTIQERYPNIFELKNDLNSLSIEPIPVSVTEFMPKAVEQDFTEPLDEMPPKSKAFGKTEKTKKEKPPKEKKEKKEKKSKNKPEEKPVITQQKPVIEKVDISAKSENDGKKKVKKGAVAAGIGVAAVVIAGAVFLGMSGIDGIPVNTSDTAAAGVNDVVIPEVTKPKEKDSEVETPANNEAKEDKPTNGNSNGNNENGKTTPASTPEITPEEAKPEENKPSEEKPKDDNPSNGNSNGNNENDVTNPKEKDSEADEPANNEAKEDKPTNGNSNGNNENDVTTTTSTTPEITPEENTPQAETKPKETEPKEPEPTTKPAVTSITIGGVKIKTDQEIIDISNLSLRNSDIKKLSELTAPKEIIMSNNPNVTDLSCLSSLKSLEKLTFHCCSVTDLSFLKKLPNLKVLGAEDNGITDISALSNLKKLSELWIHNNKITNISVLKNLKTLEYINLDYNPIKDFSPLSSLTKLQWLALTECGVTDLSFAKNMTRLNTLYLQGNQIRDISPLKNCTKMVTLVLSESHFGNASALKGMTKMVELHLYDCGLTNIDFMSGMTSLKTVNICYNNISDLTPLANCTKLTYLDASYNSLNGNLEALRGITVVGDVHVEGNNYETHSEEEILNFINTYMYGPFTFYY